MPFVEQPCTFYSLMRLDGGNSSLNGASDIRPPCTNGCWAIFDVTGVENASDNLLLGVSYLLSFDGVGPSGCERGDCKLCAVGAQKDA
jgi:hypothetical protein